MEKSRYNILLQLKADLMNEARGVYTAAQDEERDLTDSEKQRDDSRGAQLSKITDELLDLDRERAKAAGGESVEITGSGMGDGYPPVPASAPHLAVAGPRRAADLFGAPAASPWASAEEFFGAIHSDRHHPDLIPMATQTVGTPSEGGFAVPDPIIYGLLDASLESEIVRPRAEIHEMTSATKRIWGLDASDMSEKAPYGMTYEWIAEGSTINVDTAKVRQILLDAKKIALLPQASNELIADGVGFETQLLAAMVKGLGWGLDFACLQGSGGGMPLGVLNASCLITQPKETGQTAATIVYKNLTGMFSRLHPASVGRSVWVASPAAIPELCELTVLIGAGGAHVPVMKETGAGFSILTRPVLFSEKLATLGQKGDIMLCDFSQYAIGLRKGMSIDKSQHVGFTSDLATYRGLIRADGQPKWNGVFTPANGNTQSPFVTLAARP